MSDRNPLRIARITDFQMTQDGAKYAFVIVTKQGVAIDLEIEAEEIGTLVQFLVSQAAALGRQRDLDGFERNELANSYSPIPTEGYGMSTGANSEQMLLVVRLYSFELAFEIPRKHLAELGEKMRRTGILMSSDNPNPN